MSNDELLDAVQRLWDMGGPLCDEPTYAEEVEPGMVWICREHDGSLVAAMSTEDFLSLREKLEHLEPRS